MSSSRPPQASAKRRTIAVLLDFINFVQGSWETQMRRAFHETCEELDLNLLIVAGRSLDDPSVSGRMHNAIFDGLGQRVDGAILLSPALATYGRLDLLDELCHRLASIPLVSMGLALEDVPSFVIDNRAGIRVAVDHLVQTHGCRKLAFVGGPPGNEEARARRSAFEEALRDHGLIFDPELVENGGFLRQGGYEAALALLNRGIGFDAIVAANDGSAMGVLSALRERGVRVPEDVALTGFDDLADAQLTAPPLTTVAQRLEYMAESAVRSLAARFAGKDVPAVTEVGVRLVVRDSCGCSEDLVASVPERSPDATKVVLEYIETHREHLVHALSTPASDARRGLSRWAPDLLAALIADLTNGTKSFPSRLAECLEQGDVTEHDHQDLHAGLTRLRNELSRVSTPALEDLLHTARSVIGLASARAQSLERLAFDGIAQALVHAGEQLSTAHDLDELAQAVASVLPGAGMPNAYVSLRAGVDAGRLEPWVALIDGKRVPQPPGSFDAQRVYPDGGFADSRRHTSFVLPLAFEQEYLGVAVFEYQSGFGAHPMIQEQISAGLHRVAMRDEVMRQAELLERSAQERAATAQRMESLALLAGGVAHDLNNYLAPLLALPEVMLTDIAELEDQSGVEVSELKADVESIRSVALRASQTIKDLLTLGRQGKTHREPRELNTIVRSALAATRNRTQEDFGDPVNIRLDLHPQPLPVEASEAHLVRVVVNLIRNAADAISGAGSIRIQTKPLRLEQAQNGYEVVPAGHYAVVEIADTGKGIPKELLTRVFEPFFSKKELGEKSGSGLGLAIVHSVVKEHEGFVDVRSEVGQGTTFTLYFPHSSLDRLAPVLPSARPPGRGRILIVGDDEIQLRAVQRVLTGLGYVARTERRSPKQTASVEELATEDEFDVLIVDGLDDEAVDLERVQRLVEGAGERRVVLAAAHRPRLPEGVDWATKVTLLEKPYTPGALARAVQQAFG